MWQMVGMFARSTLPARLTGLYLAIQGVGGLVASAIVGTVVQPRYGASGGFLALAAVSLTTLLLVPLLPESYAQLHKSGEEAPSSRPSPAGFSALASMFLMTAAIVAAWIYLPPLALQNRLAPWVIAWGTPAAYGAEIAGGMMAAALAHSLSWRVAVPGATLSFIVLLVAFIGAPTSLTFIIGMGLFGFLWMFTVPFHYSYSIGIDPSRTTMLYVSPIQLLGCGAGPLVAALGVHGNDIHGAEWLAVVLFFVSQLLFFVPVLMTRRYSVEIP